MAGQGSRRVCRAEGTVCVKAVFREAWHVGRIRKRQGDWMRELGSRVGDRDEVVDGDQISEGLRPCEHFGF